MASSATPDETQVGYAQHHVTVLCDVCDSEKNVRSYCTDCVKNMCRKCEKVHNKLHTDHNIISAFEGRIIRHFNTKCQTHDLVFTYHCNNCQMNICTKCRKTIHRKCNTADIDKHAEMIKSSFIKRVEKQRKHLPEIDQKSNSIKEHLTTFDKITKTQIDLVETETEKLHRYLDAKKSKLIKQLKSEQASAHKTLQDQMQTLHDLKMSIDDITTSLKTKTDLVPDAGVLQLVKEGNRKLDSTSIKTIFELPNPSTFTPSPLCDKGKNILGSLQYTDKKTIIIDTHTEQSDTPVDFPDTKATSSPNIHQSTTSGSFPSIRYEISFVNELSLDEILFSCASDGNMCWAGSSGLYSNAVQLINQRGDQLLCVELSHGARYIAITTSGELLVSGYDTTVISRVNKTGQVRKFTDISAPGVLCVNGLVTTQHGDVFVCVSMAGNTKDKVLTFSGRGKKITELSFHLFTSTKLLGIHAVSRDTFCVQDGGGREGGRLVFVDNGGQLVRHIDRTTTELQRVITALAGDRHGHLIIATGESIHVLSGDGTCKCTYDILESRWIQCVSVGEDDLLWVATDTGELVVAKYLE